MKYRVTTLSLLASIACVLPVYPAEQSCPYCGIWVPYSEKVGSDYRSNDRLTLTEHTIALPGRSPTKATQVFVTHETGYVPPETARHKPLKAILRMEGEMECARGMPDLANGALVEIELRPRSSSEELVLTLFAPESLEELKASYMNHLTATSRGKKDTVKRPPFPASRTWRRVIHPGRI